MFNITFSKFIHCCWYLGKREFSSFVKIYGIYYGCIFLRSRDKNERVVYMMYDGYTYDNSTTKAHTIYT